MREIELRPVAKISEVVQDWHPIHVSVGPSADPVILCSDKPLGYDVIESAGKMEVRQHSEGPIRLRVHHLVHGQWNTLTLPERERGPHFMAQPFGAAECLIVRTRIPPGSLENNAEIYSEDGQLVRSFHASDAIEHVQVSEAGYIWIGYFDEGALTGPELARSGLVCFDPNGVPIFRYSDLAQREHIPFIDDCYALNVVSDRTVWVSYGDFPLVRLDGHQLHRIWDNVPIAMAAAFAVNGERVLFGGGHPKEQMTGSVWSDDPNLLDIANEWARQFQERAAQPEMSLLDLQTMAVEPLQAIRPSGAPIGRSQFFGRGEHLYAVCGDELLTVALSDIR